MACVKGACRSRQSVGRSPLIYTLKPGGPSVAMSQPWKKQRVDEPEPSSSVLTFFSDGSFRRVPIAQDSEAVPRNRQQITTVFAADGRYVHLENPSAEVLQHSGWSAQQKRSQRKSEGTLALRPMATNVAANSHAGAGDSKASHAASGLSLGANMPSPQASEKSWLDSRLERARTLPPPSVKQDTTSATKSQGPAANVMVELRVAQRSPKNSTESAACLRINASSTEALDKVLTESVGSLLSAMKPALS